MGNCSFCDSTSVMPYTCSLCQNKYCGKHRLPETHECVNIKLFDTDDYRRQKLAKSRIPRNAVSVNNLVHADFNENTRGFWTSGNNNKDIFYGALILSLIATITSIPVGLTFFVISYGLSLIYGTFGMFTIFLVRNQVSKKYNATTRFLLWPIGVAITLLLSIFGSFWILLGYFFIEGEPSRRGRGIIGIVSTLTALGLSMISFLLFSFFPNLITLGFMMTGGLFVLMAILNLLPIWGVDGQHLLEWNPKVYFTLVIVTIITLVYFWARIF